MLLLEAGGNNTEPSNLYLANRFTTLMTDGMNWGYKTAPQTHLNGREIDYSRGKGLGGSSGINFACYTIGPRDDYDAWSEAVGDEAFGWEQARARYKRLEAYDVDVPEGFRRFVDPGKGVHGTDGPLQVEFAKGWEWSLEENIKAAAEAIGMRPNLDINSGDPMGIGVVPSTSRNSIRSTAKTAFLADVPPNLTVLTEALVEKVVFSGKKAVGVVSNGETCEYWDCCLSAMLRTASDPPMQTSRTKTSSSPPAPSIAPSCFSFLASARRRSSPPMASPPSTTYRASAATYRTMLLLCSSSSSKRACSAARSSSTTRPRSPPPASSSPPTRRARCRSSTTRC